MRLAPRISAGAYMAEQQEIGPGQAAAPAGPLGEHQREVQEQRRQQRHRHGVAPVERPVKAIERAVEGERERTEERHAEPEEMKRGLIARAPEPHGCADDEREEPDSRKHEVHRRGPGRLHQRHLERFPAVDTKQRVRQPHSSGSAVLEFDDIRRRFDRYAVDGKQDVTRLHAGCGRAANQLRSQPL